MGLRGPEPGEVEMEPDEEWAAWAGDYNEPRDMWKLKESVEDALIHAIDHRLHIMCEIYLAECCRREVKSGPKRGHKAKPDPVTDD